MELNTARVFVRDIDAAKQFYSGKLGLPLKADGSQFGYCVFKAGNTELVVEVVADDAPEDDRVLVGRFTGLSFTVKNCSEKHRDLVALGVPSPVRQRSSSGEVSSPRFKILQETSFKLFSSPLRPNPSLKLSANGMSRCPSSAGASPHFALAVQRAMPLSPA